VQLSPEQRVVATEYFTTGRAVALMGGVASGKTYLLAFLAAAELAAGARGILYRHAADTQRVAAYFREDLARIIGQAAVRRAVDGGVLALSGGVEGRLVAVELIDDLFVMGLSPPGSRRAGGRPGSPARLAAVGSLPAGTMVLPARANPFAGAGSK
jgi:hypothetical protein